MGRETSFAVSTCKLVIVVCTGVVCLVLSLLLTLLDPIPLVAKYQARLTPGSPLHEFLLGEVDSVRVAVYLFNITNSDRFATGEDKKLQIKEIGPFTYRETRRNLNVELDMDGGVLRYTPHVSLRFMPEESVADPGSINITVANPSLLSMTSMLVSYSYFIRVGFNLLLNQVKTKPFISLSVHDYLWGYKDPLISMANTYLPNWIYFDKIGILDRIYEKRKNRKLMVGGTDADKFQIKTMDDLGGLKIWGYENDKQRTKCNSFTDVYEGLGYPPDMTTETPVRLYRTALCRFLELQYVKTETMFFGGEALVYDLKNNSYTLDEDNQCLCSHGICIEGMSDISPCYNGLPFAISHPHFYGVKPEVTSHIEGLNPDPDKYRNRFVIDPILGMSLESDLWAQMNLVVGDVRYNEIAARFADMIVPLGNLRVTQLELPDETKRLLKLMYIIVPKVLLGIDIVLGLVGLTLLAYAAWLIYFNSLNSSKIGTTISMHNNLMTKPKRLSVTLELDSEYQKLNPMI